MANVKAQGCKLELSRCIVCRRFAKQWRVQSAKPCACWNRCPVAACLETSAQRLARAYKLDPAQIVSHAEISTTSPAQKAAVGKAKRFGILQSRFSNLKRSGF